MTSARRLHGKAGAGSLAPRATETHEVAACVAPPAEELRWILTGEDDQLGGQLMGHSVAGLSV